MTAQELAAKVWKTADADAAAVERLKKDSGHSRALCAVMIARGMTDTDALDAYLNPRLSRMSDPFALPQMDLAVDRILRSISHSETLVVYGDYDVDGITSTALLIRVLRGLGAQVFPFVPHRVDDGYGLGVEPVQRCIEQFNPTCIITVDCGTGSVEAVEVAREAGVDVVVTDHHEPGEHVARAIAVVNPKCGPPDDPARLLAGVGVAFKLCHALLKRLRDEGSEPDIDLRQYLDLVALGTVADMVPLEGENRALTRFGLGQMARTQNVGLRALMDVAGVRGAVEAYHVGFVLGPRLNAAGRLDTALTSLDLLLTEDPEAARAWAEELDAANRERQQVEVEIVEEAMEQVDAWYRPDEHFGIVAAQQGWHPGVIGIVASRLCARYHRPVVVIALDEESGTGRGSCRSISALNMVEALGDCAPLLIKHGGHAMAAGLELEAIQLDAFRTAFNEAAKTRLQGTDLRPEQRVDAWLSLSEGTWALMEEIERMEPFGLGNPKPVWAVRGARILGQPRVLKEKHLKMTLLEGNDKLETIGFNLADRPLPEDQLDVVFQLNRNRFRDRETLQGVVLDFRPSEADE